MTKIFSWFPAVLCVGLFIVACGGGGNDVSIPPDAKICEIQTSTDPAGQLQTSGLLDSDLGIQIMPTETGTRYNVSVEEKRPFYAYLSSQYSGGGIFHPRHCEQFVYRNGLPATLSVSFQLLRYKERCPCCWFNSAPYWIRYESCPDTRGERCNGHYRATDLSLLSFPSAADKPGSRIVSSRKSSHCWWASHHTRNHNRVFAVSVVLSLWGK